MVGLAPFSTCYAQFGVNLGWFRFPAKNTLVSKDRNHTVFISDDHPGKNHLDPGMSHFVSI